MDKNKKKKQFVPVSGSDGAVNKISNDEREWDIIDSDVLGSYTGMAYNGETPVQDADDL